LWRAIDFQITNCLKQPSANSSLSLCLCLSIGIKNVKKRDGLRTASSLPGEAQKCRLSDAMRAEVSSQFLISSLLSFKLDYKKKGESADGRTSERTNADGA